MDAFIGEIRLLPYTFAPIDWLPCDGRSLSISSYEALYTLIGTTYGGNGQTTFNLPNLQGRSVVGVGQGAGLSNYILGQTVGAATITLTSAQIAAHNHGMQKRSPATLSTTTLSATPSPSNALSRGASVVGGLLKNNFVYGASSDGTTLAPTVIGLAGGGQPHDNSQPNLQLNYCISTSGIYPSFG